MVARAAILGCLGSNLTPAERRFFAAADPWGFILFARNVESPAQVLRLTSDLRAAVGREAPVLVDQEGGRVARLRGPHWREWRPAFDDCTRLPDPDLRVRAMRLRYRLIAAELRAVGIDVNCAPVLDCVHPGTHPVLRNRAYCTDPGEVSRIGRAVADGLLAGGVLPVIKHIPGQGRADLDSHLALPTVSAPDLEADFAPFRALADLPLAMTAHVVFEALDGQAPATQSPGVIALIRERIGFDGLLMTDDLSMQALTGTWSDRAARSFAAGVDVVLHCNGDPDEAAGVIDATPRLGDRAARRAEAALARRGPPLDCDLAEVSAEYAALERYADAG